MAASDSVVTLVAPRTDSSGGDGGDWSADVLEEARQTILTVMRGAGGRNAAARIKAASVVLGTEFTAHLPDEALLAEVRRRSRG